MSNQILALIIATTFTAFQIKHRKTYNMSNQLLALINATIFTAFSEIFIIPKCEGNTTIVFVTFIAFVIFYLISYCILVSEDNGCP